jgi:hypothetical protein
VAWTVRNHDEFDPEYENLPEAVRDEILALLPLLQEYGPAFGRPHVDTLNDSKHANLKESVQRCGRRMARCFCFRP